MFDLYGSTTSPYVRRVRIVASALSAPLTLVDWMASEKFKTLAPLGKIPVADFAGTVVFDSHQIVDHLLATHGHGPLRPVTTIEERNRMFAIDGALDGGIQRFYLLRDGATAPAYVEKQLARIRNVMSFVDATMPVQDTWSIVEIALVTAVDWMAFRQVYDVAAHHPNIARIATKARETKMFSDNYPSVN